MKTVRLIKVTYYLISSLFWLAIALPMALTILIAQSRGLDLAQVGLLFGLYSLTIVLLEVPTGGLADSIGRKRVALLAYSVISVAKIIFLFSFSFPSFLLSMFLNGLGRALASGTLDAWFIDALKATEPDVDIQPALAQGGTFILLALGIGTLLGGLIPQWFSWLPAEGTAVVTPLSITILFSLLIQIIMMVVILLLVREERITEESRSEWWNGFRQIPVIVTESFHLTRKNPTILLLLGTTLASGLAIISMEVLWQPHFARLLNGSEGHSLFFGAVLAGNFLVGMVGNIISIPVSKLFKKRYGLVAAIFQGMRGGFLILLGLQTSVIPAVFLFWLVYMNMGLINSLDSTLINEQIPDARRSSMLSIQSMATYVGSIIGSIGLSYVAEISSTNIAWILAGIVLMISLGLYFQVDIQQNQTKTNNNDQKAQIFETG